MLVDALRSFRRNASAPRVRPRRGHRLGRPRTAAEALERRDLLSAVTFFQKFEEVDWTSAGAGGIGNYNGGVATLSVGDVSGEIVAGYLYWQGIDTVGAGGNGVYDNETVTFDGVQVVGASLGTGGTGGWGTGGSQAFRADVTALLRTGVQSYSVAGLASKRGHNANGVSLVVVYRDGDLANDRDLYILNGNHVSGGTGGDGTWTARVDGLIYRHGDVRAQLHLADGQSLSDSAVQFNGLPGMSHVVADKARQFDGDSVASMGRGRAINGSLWDVNWLDATAATGGAPGTYSIDLTQSPSSSDSLALVALLFDTSSRPLNTPPVASDLSHSGREDEPVTGRLAGFDADGDPLTYSLASPPASGRLVLNSRTGEFTWTPPTDWSGTVTFTYRASDGEAGSNVATVTLTLDAVNDPPVLAAPVLSTDEDVPAAGAVTARDVDDAALTFSLVSGPSHGTVALADDGSFVYTPHADFFGEDSFTVAVSDGQADPVTAVVTVSVAAVNDPPVVAPPQVTVDEDSSVSGAVTASDVDDAVLSFLLLDGPDHGTLSFAADGTFVYTPHANRHGGDSFTVSVTDGKSDPVTVVVPVRVLPVNDVPTASDAEFTVYGNSPAGTFVGRVAASDVDGDALTYAIASGDESGAFRIDAATGEIFVLDGGKLNARTTPEIRLTVTVSDGQGGVATATVLVKVRAQAVTFQVNYGNPIDLRGFPWLPVVVYSTDTFDARQVDVRSMTFGRTGDEQSFPHVFGRRFFYYLDMNRDGRLDLVMLFDVRRTGLQEGDTAVTLRGRLMDGTEFAGTTPVVVTDGRRRGRR